LPASCRYIYLVRYSMEDLQVKVVTKPLEGEQSTNVCCSFDDDFTTDQVLPVAVKYQPLHDSVEYLAKLGLYYT